MAGAFALMLSSCALSLQSLPKVTGSIGPTYDLYAVFANVLNLPSDAQVRLGAEVVGEVGSISTRDFQADLTLAIEQSVRLPVGTTAQIRFDNPLGDEYVLLQTPAGSTAGSAAALTSSGVRYLEAGQTIGESDTSTAPSVEDTFGALSLVLNGGGLNQLQVIIHELNNTFNGNQAQIRSFLRTIDGGARTVEGGISVVDEALAAIRKLSSQLAAGGGQIAGGIAVLSPAVGVLASENTQISQLLAELSNLGTVGTNVARQSGQSSVNDIHDLVPVVEQLLAVSGKIGPDLADLARFEGSSVKVAPGDYLQVSALVNVLLPAGAYQPSAPAASRAVPGSCAGQADALTTLLSAGLE